MICRKYSKSAWGPSIKKTGLIFIILFFATGFTASAPAQTRLEIPSSANPVGSGARAMGMGGAFIAIADDATAASWNPGGLVQLKYPELSFVTASVQRKEDNTFGNNPEADGLQRISGSNLNYFSAVIPFYFVNRNMVLSFSYQHLYDFIREWHFTLIQDSDLLSVNRDIHYKQDGRLSAMGIAYCIQMTPRFSFGATFNIWDDGTNENGWEQETYEKNINTHLPSGTTFSRDSFYRERYEFHGFNSNFNLGFLWEITDKIRAGAVFKSPFTATLKHEGSFDASYQDAPQSFRQDTELDMPMSYGLGLAYEFSDRFRISADIYRTEWDDYILRDAKGNEKSPVTGRSLSESDISPTNQIRMGGEYLIMDPAQRYVIPIRCGLFYDPAPASKNPDDYYGFSLGTGFNKSPYIFDIACQYRFGRNVGGYMLRELNFSQDIHEHTIYASLIYHF